MASRQKILKEFRRLKKHPKGHLIKRRDDFVKTGIFIPLSAACVIGVTRKELYFSRKSLKHLAEKFDGRFLLEILPTIIREHDFIFRGKKDNRFLIVKNLKERSGRPHAVSIEIMKKDNLLVVTIFKTDGGYLEDFEILWRTGAG